MNRPSDEQGSSFAIASERDKWAVILAGGDGSRLLAVTRKIAGDDRPKQFCPIINEETLLDETRRRVALALSPEKTMFVLTEKHDRYYNKALEGVSSKNLVIQPRNAGTTPAILYSLLRLEQMSPTAIAAFFPSDHYFSDDSAFMCEVERALTAATRRPHLVILMGIEPECPDEEYGWIEADREISISDTSDIWKVRRFWEKPSLSLARTLLEGGCYLNSFVMVGAVSAFLNMIRSSTGDLYAKFAAVKSTLSTATEKNEMRALYNDLPDSNFSREVLQVRPMDLAVAPVCGSRWSDL